MAHINLLPWREELRKQQKQEFAVVSLLTIVLGGLVVLYAHLHIAGLISAQNARNEYLKSEIAILDKRIKEIEDLEATKARLQARINIIQQLQRSRPRIVHLFDELVVTLPDGVYLTGVTQKAGAVTVTGVAQSNARVSAFMRNVEASKWIGSPMLDVIQSKKQDAEVRSNDFTMHVKQLGEEPEVAEAAPPRGKAAKTKTRTRPKAGGKP